MSDAQDETNTKEQTALYSAVKAHLAVQGSLPSFPELLKKRYDADRAGPRARELRNQMVMGPFACFAVILLVHLVVLERPNLISFLTQLVLLPPIIFLAIHRYARPEVPTLWREGMVLVLSCLVVLGSMLDIATSPTDIVVMNMFLIVAPVVGCMFFTRMTPISGLIFVGFTTACLSIVILARSDIPPAICLYPLGCILSAATFSLFALRELDSALRRIYLHGLEQTLRIEMLSSENRSLDLLSATDQLTGAANRRQFDKVIGRLRPSRSAAHFLLMIDIDFFKQINDRFGHQDGDACIREVVSVMNRLIRPTDTVARIGGDEFAVLLTDCSVLDARRTAERICVGVAEHRFEINGRIHRISVTIGGAEFDPDGDVDRLTARADAALYQAKRAGRGRVVWAALKDLAVRVSATLGPDDTQAATRITA